jgi:hypothetical protein
LFRQRREIGRLRRTIDSMQAGEPPGATPSPSVDAARPLP